jgi:hypothetical protein
MDLVEKIARALARHSIEPWDDLSPENRDGYEDDARSVLSCIEEEGMVVVPLDRHTHVAGEGDDIDCCRKCGKDIRDRIHFRMDEGKF